MDEADFENAFLDVPDIKVCKNNSAQEQFIKLFVFSPLCLFGL